jgi:hypothetical protein
MQWCAGRQAFGCPALFARAQSPSPQPGRSHQSGIRGRRCGRRGGRDATSVRPEDPRAGRGQLLTVARRYLLGGYGGLEVRRLSRIASALGLPSAIFIAIVPVQEPGHEDPAPD